MKGKVSIIVPIYNAELFLAACIESITSQRYKNIEIILVDDGSVDGSANVCQRYAQKDCRIIYIRQENAGVSSARNKGLETATGDYVLFVDSDDRLKCETVEYLVRENVEKDHDLVISSYYSVYKDHIESVDVDEAELYDTDKIAQYFAQHFLEGSTSSVWAKLYKRNLIQDCFRTDISMGEDLLFNLHYLQRAKSVRVINEKLYLYNQANPNSLVNNFKFFYYEQNFYVCSEWIKWLRGNDVLDPTINNVYYHISSLFNTLIFAVAQNKNVTDKVTLLDKYYDQKTINVIKLTLHRFNFIQRKIFKLYIKKKFKRALRQIYKYASMLKKTVYKIKKFKQMTCYVLYKIVGCRLPSKNSARGFFQKIRYSLVKNYIEYCGKDVNIQPHSVIARRISIGNYSGVGKHSLIQGNVLIGNHVMMGPEVNIYTQNHNFTRCDIPMDQQGFAEEKGVIIEDDVWIGSRVTILPGVIIGKGSVVGASAVVTKSVAPYSVVAGNPARVVKMRCREKKID